MEQNLCVGDLLVQMDCFERQDLTKKCSISKEGYIKRKLLMLVLTLTIRPSQQNPLKHPACFELGDGTIPKALNAIRNAFKDAGDWVRSRFGVRRMFDFSDGAGQELSCATLLRRLSSSRQFLHVPMMWMYATPGHGKGVCNGDRGAIKKMI